MNLLRHLIKFITSTFDEDPTAPSVVSSWLESERVWYVSVVRYKGKFAEGKEVVMSVRHKNLVKAYRILAERLTGKQHADRLNDLAMDLVEPERPERRGRPAFGVVSHEDDHQPSDQG